MATNSRTILVSNIAPTIAESTLQTFFNYCGEIEMMEKLNTSSDTKYQIIFMEESSAQKAIKLNGTPMLGFKLQITGLNTIIMDTQTSSSSSSTFQTISGGNVAAEILIGASQESSSKALNPFIQQIGDPNVDNNLVYSTGDVEKDKEIARTIYVGNINLRANHNDLVDFFSSCGPIACIRLAGDDKHPCRFAFIEFLEIEAANKAILLSGSKLLDKEIKVNRSKKSIAKHVAKLTPQEEKKFNDAVKYLTNKLEQYEKDPKGFTDMTKFKRNDYSESGGSSSTSHHNSNYSSSMDYRQQQHHYHSGGGGGGGSSYSDNRRIGGSSSYNYGSGGRGGGNSYYRDNRGGRSYDSSGRERQESSSSHGQDNDHGTSKRPASSSNNSPHRY